MYVYVQLVTGLLSSRMVRVWSDEPVGFGVSRQAVDYSCQRPVCDVSDPIGDYVGQHACSSLEQHVQ